MKYQILHPLIIENSECEFNVWAPSARNIKLIFKDKGVGINMIPGDFGYWKIKITGIEPGRLYNYQINNDQSFPDPASLSQPEGVHGHSEIIDLQSFQWSDKGWQNIPISEMIQYELHTGTFTPEGNFEGILSKLDYLKDLGINTIELLPVTQFSGKRNWGYDGVYPYAVHNSYGGAHKLMELVNECHRSGIAVILDVVYNHFGPEGNYVSNFGPYFSGKYSTPWGKPVNFDGPYSDGIRNYVIQNALMWCRDFHIDGLRLDAVHSIYDFSAKHIMQELAENLKNLSNETGRDYYLIAESNLNDVRYISPPSNGGYGLDAQWSDDFHHSIHTLVTGEKRGYYMDFGEDRQLSKAIKSAFVFNGEYSHFRKKTYGNSTDKNTGDQFVIFSQNHDQTGNRKDGERLIELAGFETVKLIAGTLFVTPNIPMLFMGEEYGERNPFLYFVSHLDPELNRKVREGRQKEFEDFYDDNKPSPDPAAEETFEKSQLSWGIERDPDKSAMFEYYRELIRLRKHHEVLKETDREKMEIFQEHKFFTLKRWNNGKRVLVFINFNDRQVNQLIPSDLKTKMNRILDSSDKKWRGPGILSPASINPGEEITIAKKTIVIYSN